MVITFRKIGQDCNSDYSIVQDMHMQAKKNIYANFEEKMKLEKKFNRNRIISINTKVGFFVVNVVDRKAKI